MYKLALVAGPLSPLKLAVPFPATVVIDGIDEMGTKELDVAAAGATINNPLAIAAPEVIAAVRIFHVGLRTGGTPQILNEGGVAVGNECLTYIIWKVATACKGKCALFAEN